MLTITETWRKQDMTPLTMHSEVIATFNFNESENKNFSYANKNK